MSEQLTHDELARLQAELAELEGPRRAEIIEEIAKARGYGDLSENFEYHAAKEEQGRLESKIFELRERIANVTIIEAPTATDRVSVGSIVEIENETGERLKLRVTSLMESNGKVDRVSPESPLGRALLGCARGETVTVPAPRGAWQAKIRKIEAA